MFPTVVPSLTDCPLGFMQNTAGHIREQIGLPISLLHQHELAGAHISNSFCIEKVGTLRAWTGGRRHGVDHLPGLRDLND